jgi:hypothetical protein
MRRDVPRALVLLATVVLLAAGCAATGEVPIATGAHSGSEWTAVLHRFDNGLVPDGRLCVQVRFQDRAPVDGGCGPVERRADMEVTSGFVIARTSDERAIKGQYVGSNGEVITAPLGSGEPLSRGRWMVVAPAEDPVGVGPTHVRVVFLDAFGNEVDSVGDG